LASKKIEEFLYTVFDRLPQRIKALIHPVGLTFYFLKRVFFAFSQFRLPVYLLRGKEKWGGGNLTTLILGDERGLLYLSDLLYSEKPIRKSLGKVFIWRIKSRLDFDLPRADLILIKMHGFFFRFLSRQGFMIIPEWVLFMLDLSKPLEKAWNLSKSKNKSLRENLREFRKHNYSYEMTCDPTKFEYFYNQMYLPYVQGRFGELTVVTGFRDMERVFKKGQLLLIKKGNDYISGNIVRMDRDTVFVLYLGITEGKIEYLKAGALTALYYFTILWAKEEGYKWIDFGHCRSFLKDGVFKYKKHWGMEIKISKRFEDIFGMKIYNFRQGVQNFLENNPFVFIHQEKLKGLILADQSHPLTFEEAQTLLKTYSIPGLDGMVILSGQGFTQEAGEFINSCSPPRLHLISKKTDAFFEAFPQILHLRKHTG
jgi:hypothetical protein